MMIEQASLLWGRRVRWLIRTLTTHWSYFPRLKVDSPFHALSGPSTNGGFIQRTTLRTTLRVTWSAPLRQIGLYPKRRDSAGCTCFPISVRGGLFFEKFNTEMVWGATGVILRSCKLALGRVSWYLCVRGLCVSTVLRKRGLARGLTPRH